MRIIQNLKDVDVIISSNDRVVRMFNCERCSIVAPGPLTSLMVYDCNNVSIKTNKVFATFDVFRCRNVQIDVTENIGLLVLESSRGVTINCSKNGLRVVCTRVSNVKLGDEWYFEDEPEYIEEGPLLINPDQYVIDSDTGSFEKINRDQSKLGLIYNKF